MADKKHILIINGSASSNSSNEKLIHFIVDQWSEQLEFTMLDDLKGFPHFDPELSVNNTPPLILDLRNKIEKADGIIICTPEYIFSIPSGLKNIIEWCVSTNIFENKAAGLIIASADGQKAKEELQLIMRTVMANFTEETTLWIRGIKGKISDQGDLKDESTREQLIRFMESFRALLS